MVNGRNTYRLLSCMCAFSLLPLSFAQSRTPNDARANAGDKPRDRISRVVTEDENGTPVTKIFIDLQKNSMEPVAEPRRIQVDDRANVQLVVRNVRL